MEKDQLSRKLAVILHADVVGSTSLVQKNESLSHTRIKNCFQKFSETIDTYGGIVHEIRGDALVAEFERASDAVTASLAFQKLNTVTNLKNNDEIQPVLRIGVSLGEVIVADGTMTGEGVVLAQRLEQLATPGGVVVQGSVSETVPGRMPFEFESLGEQVLKGFEKPVRAFAATLQSDKTLPLPDAVGSSQAEGAGYPEMSTKLLSDTYETLIGERLELPDKPSIAVLPFQNMSGDPEQEHFADGISEDIITALSRVPDIVVIARNSTFVYKGRAVDVRQVGNELGVGSVLEGSIRKSGDRLRVTAQLVNTLTGDHIWAERYDRKLDDIFTIQDEITHNIVVELQVKLVTGQNSRLSAIGTDSIEAWSLVLRAGPLVESHEQDNAMSAKIMLHQALELDKNYAAAWVLLGWIHWEESVWGWCENIDQSLQLALEAAEHSRSADPGYPDTYSLLGQIYRTKGDLNQAIEMNEKAFQLAPNDAGVVAIQGSTLVFCGKVKEGIRKIYKALRLSPFPPPWYLTKLGYALHIDGDNVRAIPVLRTAVKKEPNSHLGRVWLVSALFEAGEISEAREFSESVLAIEPDFSVNSWVKEFDGEQINRVSANLLSAGLPK
jgi:adenylate cyclase